MESAGYTQGEDPMYSYEFQARRIKMTKKRKIVIGIILGILVFIGGSVGKFQYDQYREKSYKNMTIYIICMTVFLWKEMSIQIL